MDNTPCLPVRFTKPAQDPNRGEGSIREVRLPGATIRRVFKEMCEVADEVKAEVIAENEEAAKQKEGLLGQAGLNEVYRMLRDGEVFRIGFSHIPIENVWRAYIYTNKHIAECVFGVDALLALVLAGDMSYHHSDVSKETIYFVPVPVARCRVRAELVMESLLTSLMCSSQKPTATQA